MKKLNQINRLVKKDLFDYSESDPPKNKERRDIKPIFVFALILLIASSALYYLFHKNTGPKQAEETITKNSSKIATQAAPSTLFKKVNSIKSIFTSNDFKGKKLNILALGRPGAGHPGENLTDTIIIFHFEPNKKLVLISLPRDLLIKIPGRQGFTKINNLYNLGGLEMIRQKIEEITDVPINYYALVDLTAVEEIIDLIDGVNVFVPQDINDPHFPGPNYSYEAFALKAGWRYLDGETALKYIRTRYSKQGDFDRISRQQQILRALKQKVLSLNPFLDLPIYLKIFQSLNEHIQTDLSLGEIRSLWQTAQKIEPSQVISLSIDKERTDLLTSGPIMLNGQTASVVWPKAGQENYSEIKELIQKIVE